MSENDTKEVQKMHFCKKKTFLDSSRVSDIFIFTNGKNLRYLTFFLTFLNVTSPFYIFLRRVRLYLFLNKPKNQNFPKTLKNDSNRIRTSGWLPLKQTLQNECWFDPFTMQLLKLICLFVRLVLNLLL